MIWMGNENLLLKFQIDLNLPLILSQSFSPCPPLYVLLLVAISD